MIKDTLEYLRTKPFYWIINTEIYLDILSKDENRIYYDDNYVNKDLISVYNYVEINKFRNENDPNNNKNDVNMQLSTDPDFEIPNYLNETNLKKLINDEEYNKFVRLIENDHYLDIDYTNKNLYDMTVIPLMFKFLLTKLEHEINEKFKEEDRRVLEIKLQNFLLFFSYVEYNEDLSYIWDRKVEPITTITQNTKKYNLRLSKMNEEEMEEMFLQNQLKIIKIQDSINLLKSKQIIAEFLSYCKVNKIKEEIFKGEHLGNKSENVMNIIVYCYTLLYNVFILVEAYFKHQVETKKKLLNNACNDEQSNIDDIELGHYIKQFETYKTTKFLYKTSLEGNTNRTKEIVEFYIFVIEDRKNYIGCVNILNQYYTFNKNKSSAGDNDKDNIICNYNQFLKNKELPIEKFDKNFVSNLTEDNIEMISKEYIHNYYERDETKIKRIYKMEHAGVNWTQDDIRKFNDGLRLYGHCQLANTKIAKYMGSHIEASHVKLFRGKISKEKRDKKKKEKASKISEMKKRRNVSWKELNLEDYHNHS